MHNYPTDPKYRFYVYSLTYPDGTVFYIGKGSYRQKLRRIQHHLSNSVHSRYIKNVINKIRVSGEEVHWNILMEYENEVAAFVEEVRLIAFYGRRDMGTGILVNLTDGGEGQSGYIRSPRSAEKIRRAHIGKKCPFLIERNKKELAALNSRAWLITSPEGWQYRICNLKLFCRERPQFNLNPYGLRAVAVGERTNHRGWKCRRGWGEDDMGFRKNKKRRGIGKVRVKEWELISPGGYTFNVVNLNQFCIDHPEYELGARQLRIASYHLNRTYKGWGVGILQVLR